MSPWPDVFMTWLTVKNINFINDDDCICRILYQGRRNYIYTSFVLFLVLKFFMKRASFWYFLWVIIFSGQSAKYRWQCSKIISYVSIYTPIHIVRIIKKSNGRMNSPATSITKDSKYHKHMPYLMLVTQIRPMTIQYIWVN